MYVFEVRFMNVATGYYINLYEERNFEIEIMLNEANMAPTSEEVSIIEKLVKNEIQKSCTKEDLYAILDNSCLKCFEYGFRLYYWRNPYKK